MTNSVSHPYEYFNIATPKVCMAVYDSDRRSVDIDESSYRSCQMRVHRETGAVELILPQSQLMVTDKSDLILNVNTTGLTEALTANQNAHLNDLLSTETDPNVNPTEILLELVEDYVYKNGDDGDFFLTRSYNTTGIGFWTKHHGKETLVIIDTFIDYTFDDPEIPIDFSEIDIILPSGKIKGGKINANAVSFLPTHAHAAIINIPPSKNTIAKAMTRLYREDKISTWLLLSTLFDEFERVDAGDEFLMFSDLGMIITERPAGLGVLAKIKSMLIDEIFGNNSKMGEVLKDRFDEEVIRNVLANPDISPTQLSNLSRWARDFIGWLLKFPRTNHDCISR